MEINSVRLHGNYDVARLTADLDAATAHYASAPQVGKYHDGSWTGIALRNATGEHGNTLASHTGHGQDTEVLQHCPYFKQILDELGCPVYVARLLFLPAGKVIGEHRDPGFGWEKGVVRLHIPIITDPRVEFRIGEQNVYWKPGEFWFGDFSQPHSLHNRSDITRVHLVLDCPITPATLALFPAEFMRQVRSEAEVLVLDGIDISLDKLKDYQGNFCIRMPFLGMQLPLIGKLFVDHDMLCLKFHGLPDSYHFTPVGPDRFQCNAIFLSWKSRPDSTVVNEVRCEDKRNGMVRDAIVSPRLAAGLRICGLLQAGILGGLWKAYFGSLKLKRMFGKKRYRVKPVIAD